MKEGVTFYVKYLGSTLVEELEDGQSYGDKISTKAVQTVVNMVSDTTYATTSTCGHIVM